jgi:hypothetical protein
VLFSPICNLQLKEPSLVSADRLWIQREIPKPPKSLKRKRPDAAVNRSSKASQSAKTDHPDHRSKRRRSDRENVDDKPVTDSAVTSNSQHQTAQPSRGRAAKAQANLRLDAQAKALAAFRSEEAAAAVASSAKRGKPPLPAQPMRPLGTRLSARLRGDDADGEWQAIPEEWLGSSDPNDKAAATPPAGKGPHKTGLESDLESTSDLTELSESSEEEEDVEVEDVTKEDAEEENVNEETSSSTNIEAPKDPKLFTASKEEETEIKIIYDRDLDNILTPPEGFIEWETVSLPLLAFDSFHNLWMGRYALRSLIGNTLRIGSRNPCITPKKRCIKFSKRPSCLSLRKSLRYATSYLPNTPC